MFRPPLEVIRVLVLSRDAAIEISGSMRVLGVNEH
jgi:hypothetical protein